MRRKSKFSVVLASQMTVCFTVYITEAGVAIMTITVMVEFGDRRKKIVINEGEELVQVCRNKFEISGDQNIALEIMETEFSNGMWIDLESSDDLTNGSRLRIVVREGSNRLVSKVKLFLFDCW